MQSGEIITVTCDRCRKVFRVGSGTIKDTCPRCGAVCIVNQVSGEIQTDLGR